MYLPNSKDKFLKDVLHNLKKRHKALKHKGLVISCERLFELAGETRNEKIEIELEQKWINQRISIRVFMWADRWVWVDVRSLQKGQWAWEWSSEGRLLGKYQGQDMLLAIEKTYLYATDMTTKNTNQFLTIWRPMLASGPVIVGAARS